MVMGVSSLSISVMDNGDFKILMYDESFNVCDIIEIQFDKMLDIFSDIMKKSNNFYKIDDIRNVHYGDKNLRIIVPHPDKDRVEVEYYSKGQNNQENIGALYHKGRVVDIHHSQLSIIHKELYPNSSKDDMIPPIEGCHTICCKENSILINGSVSLPLEDFAKMVSDFLSIKDSKMIDYKEPGIYMGEMSKKCSICGSKNRDNIFVSSSYKFGNLIEMVICNSCILTLFDFYNINCYKVREKIVSSDL